MSSISISDDNIIDNIKPINSLDCPKSISSDEVEEFFQNISLIQNKSMAKSETQYISKSSLPDVAIYPTVIHFNTTYPNKTLQSKIIVSNGGTQTEIFSISLKGDPEFSVSTRRLSLSAGETKSLIVSFSPKKVSLFNSSLILEGRTSIVAPITGHCITSPLEYPLINSASWCFPMKKTEKLISFSNNSLSEPLSVILTTNCAAFKISPHTFDIPPSSACDVKFLFDPNCQTSEMPTVSIQCAQSGDSVTIPFVIAPKRETIVVDFGTISVGRKTTQTLKLKYPQMPPVLQWPFSIENISENGMPQKEMIFTFAAREVGNFRSKFPITDFDLEFKASSVDPPYRMNISSHFPIRPLKIQNTSNSMINLAFSISPIDYVADPEEVDLRPNQVSEIRVMPINRSLSGFNDSLFKSNMSNNLNENITLKIVWATSDGKRVADEYELPMNQAISAIDIENESSYLNKNDRIMNGRSRTEISADDFEITSSSGVKSKLKVKVKDNIQSAHKIERNIKKEKKIIYHNGENNMSNIKQKNTNLNSNVLHSSLEYDDEEEESKYIIQSKNRSNNTFLSKNNRKMKVEKIITQRNQVNSDSFDYYDEENNTNQNNEKKSLKSPSKPQIILSSDSSYSDEEIYRRPLRDKITASNTSKTDKETRYSHTCPPSDNEEPMRTIVSTSKKKSNSNKKQNDYLENVQEEEFEEIENMITHHHSKQSRNMNHHAMKNNESHSSKHTNQTTSSRSPNRNVRKHNHSVNEDSDHFNVNKGSKINPKHHSKSYQKNKNIYINDDYDYDGDIANNSQSEIKQGQQNKTNIKRKYSDSYSDYDSEDNIIMARRQRGQLSKGLKSQTTEHNHDYENFNNKSINSKKTEKNIIYKDTDSETVSQSKTISSTMKIIEEFKTQNTQTNTIGNGLKNLASQTQDGESSFERNMYNRQNHDSSYLTTNSSISQTKSDLETQTFIQTSNIKVPTIAPIHSTRAVSFSTDLTQLSHNSSRIIPTSASFSFIPFFGVSGRHPSRFDITINTDYEIEIEAPQWISLPAFIEPNQPISMIASSLPSSTIQSTFSVHSESGDITLPIMAYRGSSNIIFNSEIDMIEISEEQYTAAMVVKNTGDRAGFIAFTLPETLSVDLRVSPSVAIIKPKSNIQVKFLVTTNKNEFTFPVVTYFGDEIVRQLHATLSPNDFFATSFNEIEIENEIYAFENVIHDCKPRDILKVFKQTSNTSKLVFKSPQKSFGLSKVTVSPSILEFIGNEEGRVSLLNLSPETLSFSVSSTSNEVSFSPRMGIAQPYGEIIITVSLDRPIDSLLVINIGKEVIKVPLKQLASTNVHYKSSKRNRNIGDFSASNDHFEFDCVNIGNSKAVNLILINNEDYTMDLSLNSDNPAFYCEKVVSIHGNSKVSVNIDFCPKETGIFNGNLIVQNDESKICITLSGEGINDSESVNSFVNHPLEFPVCQPGTIRRAQLRVSNRTDCYAKVTAKVTPPFHCPYPQFEIEPYSYVLVPVRFIPKEPGDFVGAAEFHSSTGALTVIDLVGSCVNAS